MREWCGRSRQVEVEDQGGRLQIAGKEARMKKILGWKYKKRTADAVDIV